jgi:hypothetical protein
MTDPSMVRLGGRRVPLFRSIGIAGYYAAVLVALVAGARTGVHPIAVLGISAASGVSFFLWGLVRRAITGGESLVLIEHVWVAGIAVAAFCLAAGVDVLRGLDVLSCAVAVFLAAGRVGCFSVGCCYGVPAAIGTTYSADAGLPARLTGVRLLPVQLIEAAAWLLIAGVSLVLAGGAPGQATIWFLLAYAVVRFGTEGLRGDVRPMLAGLSRPQWMCLIQFVGAGYLAQRVISGADLRVVIAVSVVLVPAAIAGLMLMLTRRPSAVIRPEALDETWSMIERLAQSGQPLVETTQAGVRVAVSLVGPAEDAHVSLSAEHWTRAELLAVGDALAGIDVRPGEWAVHFRVDGARLGKNGSAEPVISGPNGRIMEHIAAVGSAPVAEGYFGHG